jgi:hypothetical protein
VIPEHERPDLRLVVVQPPPLEADNVLLRDALVPGGDKRRELVADTQRRLVLIEPFDWVALEHKLPGRLGLRSTGLLDFGCHSLPSLRVSDCGLAAGKLEATLPVAGRQAPA